MVPTTAASCHRSGEHQSVILCRCHDVASLCCDCQVRSSCLGDICGVNESLFCCSTDMSLSDLRDNIRTLSRSLIGRLMIGMCLRACSWCSCVFCCIIVYGRAELVHPNFVQFSFNAPVATSRNLATYLYGMFLSRDDQCLMQPDVLFVYNFDDPGVR